MRQMRLVLTKDLNYEEIIKIWSKKRKLGAAKEKEREGNPCPKDKRG